MKKSNLKFKIRPTNYNYKLSIYDANKIKMISAKRFNNVGYRILPSSYACNLKKKKGRRSFSAWYFGRIYLMGLKRREKNP